MNQKNMQALYLKKEKTDIRNICANCRFWIGKLHDRKKLNGENRRVFKGICMNHRCPYYRSYTFWSFVCDHFMVRR